MDPKIFNLICYSWIFLACCVFVIMLFVKAPFGRHTSENWGISINNKLGWIIMESPSLFIMLYFLFFGQKSFDSYVWILFLIWIIHYTNRTFIYPIKIKSTPKKMPFFITCNAIFFNLMNAGLNGYYLSYLADSNNYNSQWLFSFSFIFGGFLFILGMYINIKSDNILINLRKPGETGYKIPQKFLFKYVSSSNLFGEIIEWIGFAIMAQNLPAYTFMIWCIANLVPRAINHHNWYLSQFADYPKQRKIIFPFIY